MSNRIWSSSNVWIALQFASLPLKQVVIIFIICSLKTLSIYKNINKCCVIEWAWIEGEFEFKSSYWQPFRQSYTGGVIERDQKQKMKLANLRPTSQYEYTSMISTVIPHTGW